MNTPTHSNHDHEQRPLRVAMVERVITHYRTDFFNALAAALSRRGVTFNVFSGHAHAHEAFKDGSCKVACALPAPNRYFTARVYWQAAWRRLQGYDLVIVEQANGALLNYGLFAARALLGRPRQVAFCGHGATLDRKANSLLQIFKKRLVGLADHWFAYTEVTRKIIAETGYPNDRITVFNNAIDTAEVSAARAEAQSTGLNAFRQALGLENGFWAVFCARLSKGKNLPFVLETAQRTHDADARFHLLLIGDGPDHDLVEEFARTRSWVRYVGAQYGVKKARYLAASDIMLLPSWVGLSILDGFAAGLPVITAAFGNHCPEIAYLEDRVNGFFTSTDIDSYTGAVLSLCRDEKTCRRLSAAASATAASLTQTAMIERFADGIIAALGQVKNAR
jgi:glycosyltransferase involved in cell wall biosynthesis